MVVRDIYVKELKADSGMVLTDGKKYVKTARLAEGADASKWYEITEAEYQKILEEKEAESDERIGTEAL